MAKRSRRQRIAAAAAAAAALFAKEYKFKVHCGVGDLIHIKAQLDSILDKVDRIFITPDTAILAAVGRGKDNYAYLKFLEEFMHILFSNKKYILTKFCDLDHDNRCVERIHPVDKEYIRRYPVALHANEKIPFAYPDISALLCSVMSLEIPQKYVVITTRVRDYSRIRYEEIKINFFHTLNHLALVHNIKVLILGEKKMANTIEEKAMGIFGIYEDIISNLDSSVLIDMSDDVPLTSTPMGIEKLQQDCLYMNESLCTISFGIGGNFSLSVAANARAINLCDREKPLHPIFHNLYYEKIEINDFLKNTKMKKSRNNLLSTRDISTFLKVIENLYQLDRGDGHKSAQHSTKDPGALVP